MADTQSTVEYRTVNRFPGYCIGDDGSVWSKHKVGRGGGIGDTWRRMKTKDLDGRKIVRFRVGGVVHDNLVHRLVLEAFIGPCPPGMECCHEDGDHGNNRLSNLRWDTHQSNMDDKYKHGTNLVGEKCYQAKLTDALVRKARQRYKEENVSQAVLAEEFGVTQSTMSSVLLGKTWSHVQ